MISDLDMPCPSSDTRIVPPGVSDPRGRILILATGESASKEFLTSSIKAASGPLVDRSPIVRIMRARERGLGESTLGHWYSNGFSRMRVERLLVL